MCSRGRVVSFVFAFVCACTQICSADTQLGGPETSSEAITYSQVNQIERDIKRLIRRSRDGRGGRGSAPLLGQLVRLGFHSCPGVCDGCVNMDSSGNAGLQIPLQALADYRACKGDARRADACLSSEITITDADLITLVALIAARYGAARQKVAERFIPVFKWRWGRSSCPDPSKKLVPFPDAAQGIQSQVKYFGEQFSLSEFDTVVASGAHVLGKCSLENSGYQGPWVRDRATGGSPPENSILSNQFYRDMLNMDALSEHGVPDLNWRQVLNKRSGKFQWNSTGIPVTPFSHHSMMLNSDMGIVLDLDAAAVDSATGRVECKYSNSLLGNGKSCARPSTANMAIQLANNNKQWLTDFARVFSDMMENGVPSASLHDIVSDAGPTPAPTNQIDSCMRTGMPCRKRTNGRFKCCEGLVCGRILPGVRGCS